MDEARRRWDQGCRRRLWITADEQTAGRGRHGRNWVSPPGNLHLTLLTPTIAPLRQQPKLGFAAGVALARTVSALMPQGSRVSLKWPNDLLIGGAKAGGLLLEGIGGGVAVAIGIGVNVVAHPPDTPYGATHLQAVEPTITRETLFTSLAPALAEELDRFGDGSEFARLRELWLGYAANLGGAVVVKQGSRTLDGIFRDVDEDGRLLLETVDGPVRIDAGDVFPLDNKGAGLQELGTSNRTSAA